MANEVKTVVPAEVKPDTQTETKENIKINFEFSPEANKAMFEIFALAAGDKLKKASATRVKTLFGQYLRELMLKGLLAKRNSTLNAEYNRNCKLVDELVDSGIKRIDAEQEVFEMTETQARRALKNATSARLF